RTAKPLAIHPFGKLGVGRPVVGETEGVSIRLGAGAENPGAKKWAKNVEMPVTLGRRKSQPIASEWALHDPRRRLRRAEACQRRDRRHSSDQKSSSFHD